MELTSSITVRPPSALLRRTGNCSLGQPEKAVFGETSEPRSTRCEGRLVVSHADEARAKAALLRSDYFLLL